MRADCVLLLLFVALPRLAAADPITLAAEPVSFSAFGVVHFANPPVAEEVLGFTVAIGDPFSLAFTGSRTSEDTDANPKFGHYSLEARLSMTFGANTFTSPLQSGEAVVVNEQGATFQGDLLWYLFALPSVSFGQIFLNVAFSDPSGGWLQDDSFRGNAAVLQQAPVKSVGARATPS